MNNGSTADTGKIESLRRCINRIETKRPQTVDQLAGSLDLQDILSLNLERAVQLCVDIGSHIIAYSESTPPATMAKTFDLLADEGIITASTATNMEKAVGFRNIAVHAYQKINWKMVFYICHEKTVHFKNFAQEINSYLSEQ